MTPEDGHPRLRDDGVVAHPGEAEADGRRAVDDQVPCDPGTTPIGPAGVAVAVEVMASLDFPIAIAADPLVEAASRPPSLALALEPADGENTTSTQKFAWYSLATGK